MLNAFDVRFTFFFYCFVILISFFRAWLSFCFHVNFCLVVTYKRTPVAVRPIVIEDAISNNNTTNESRKRKLNANGK